MANHLSTAAAVLAVLLFVVGVASVANGWFLLAGLSLLSVALVIYFRETRLVDG